MNNKPIELAKDGDLRGALAALRRAEAQAERIARQTGTRLINVPPPAVSNDQKQIQGNVDSRAVPNLH